MLYLTQTITDTGYNYPLWSGAIPSINYHPYLHQNGRLYSRSFRNTGTWTYIPPPYDAFCLYAMYDTIVWPGWAICALTFDAGTFQLKEVVNLDVWAYAYLGNMSVGSLGIMFGCFVVPAFTVAQVDWRIGRKVGSWQAYTWPWGNVYFSNAIVSPPQGTILGTNQWYLELWNYSTPERLWKIHIPYIAKNLAYESETYAWILFNGGKIAKIDYGAYRRIEMYSSIATILPEDMDYKIAYDSLRKRIVIFRRKTDGDYGAARLQFEVYETVPKAAILTDPVPISTTGKDLNTVFCANLVGDAGEGIGGQNVLVELVEPNNHGRLISPNVISEINGIIHLQYRGPESAGTEQLRLTANVADSIGTGIGVGT